MQYSTPQERELTLALNAAEGRLMLALGRHVPPPDEQTEGQEAEVLFAQEWLAPAQGVELLVPALDQAMRALGLAPRHLGRVAVVNGPGSFTGLRLTTVSAAALARALGLTQAALPYLPLLAAAACPYCAPPPEKETQLWVITHARRDLAHRQVFSADTALRELSPLSALRPHEIAAELRAAPGPVWLLGSGLSRSRTFFERALEGVQGLRMLPPAFDHPSPAFLLRKALALPSAAYAVRDIAPLYARPSEAEENLPHIAAKLGLDPQTAQNRLDALLTEEIKETLVNSGLRPEPRWGE
ncbi:MAG: tRNA (adenosine(37)-N6)-threonylcarbamoyltransferase complex dimerization subunit type 1 TsaB [Deltaproteobacteria bacterium]|jgi:tRNA threonylcarbamoyl adenosine modification protein YeaZ|nr:tRNA (adenosine(37)-N6)-threonylcarbamoyltransferase complex dimerization subunit type 1 TsaB [Deltaproteobacteria bacterium]